jgi:predicted ABC-type transport system involved in lysophospholipase L1 biosynthesis ATPase subunit
MDSGPLSIEGVWKGYSRGGQRWTEVLANVSLMVEPGEVVAVTGGRLEGKTTLLKITAGLERPDKGTVSLGDRLLVDCRDGQQSELLGRQIMWVDRHGPKLTMDVLKFVGWPLALHGSGRKQAECAAAQALEQVGARKCLGRRWGDLSNWQRVLVSLARAFAGSPRVVVIDDLLDGLGGSGTEEASDLLRSLIDASRPRCGVLMSASDVESAMYADWVWSITGKRSLKLMAALRTDGKVVPFPDRDSTRAGGTLGVGSS